MYFRLFGIINAYPVMGKVNLIKPLRGDVMESDSILIVESNEKDRKILQFLLTQNGFFVKTACNGIEAINIIKQITFDLIISDFIMPFTNGFDLLKTIKQLFPDTKILILTANDDPDNFMKAFDLGAIACFKKPFVPEELKEVVDNSLKCKKEK